MKISYTEGGFQQTSLTSRGGGGTKVDTHGKVIARKKYGLRFSIQPLDFSLQTRKDSLTLTDTANS